MPLDPIRIVKDQSRKALPSLSEAPEDAQGTNPNAFVRIRPLSPFFKGPFCCLPQQNHYIIGCPALRQEAPTKNFGIFCSGTPISWFVLAGATFKQT